MPRNYAVGYDAGHGYVNAPWNPQTAPHPGEYVGADYEYHHDFADPNMFIGSRPPVKIKGLEHYQKARAAAARKAAQNKKPQAPPAAGTWQNYPPKRNNPRTPRGRQNAPAQAWGPQHDPAVVYWQPVPKHLYNPGAAHPGPHAPAAPQPPKEWKAKPIRPLSHSRGNSRSRSQSVPRGGNGGRGRSQSAAGRGRSQSAGGRGKGRGRSMSTMSRYSGKGKGKQHEYTKRAKSYMKILNDYLKWSKKFAIESKQAQEHNQYREFVEASKGAIQKSIRKFVKDLGNIYNAYLNYKNPFNYRAGWTWPAIFTSEHRDDAAKEAAFDFTPFKQMLTYDYENDKKRVSKIRTGVTKILKFITHKGGKESVHTSTYLALLMSLYPNAQIQRTNSVEQALSQVVKTYNPIPVNNKSTLINILPFYFRMHIDHIKNGKTSVQLQDAIDYLTKNASNWKIPLKADNTPKFYLTPTEKERAAYNAAFKFGKAKPREKKEHGHDDDDSDGDDIVMDEPAHHAADHAGPEPGHASERRVQRLVPAKSLPATKKEMPYAEAPKASPAGPASVQSKLTPISAYRPLSIF